MITIKDFMEVTDYRITEGSTYGWQCYGGNAYTLDSWNGDQDGHTVSMVFDTKTQVVYEFTVCDYYRDRAYRWINPDYIDSHTDEALTRDVNLNEAWDEVDYTDIEVREDILEKARAIINGDDYDTRIQVPLTLENDQLFEIMKMAHERDITLNEMVESILRKVIDQSDDILIP
jgi:hypothetical protein